MSTFKQDFSKMLRLALPMAGSRFLQMLTNFLGMLMIAQLGHAELAAGALIASSSAAIFMIFMPILFSVSVMTGQNYGAKRYTEMGELLRQAILLALIMSLPLGVLYWYIGPILIFLKQDPHLVGYVHIYFHTFIFAAPVSLVNNAIQQFLYGVLKQRIVILKSVVSLLLFVPLAYGLIFGHFGLPRLGVAGFGYAFALVIWLGTAMLLFALWWYADFHCMDIFKLKLSKQLSYLRQALKIGWPMSLQFGGELFAFFLLTVIVGWMGEQALAASQVVQQWSFLFIVPMFAISEASGILVSQEMGARQFDRVKLMGKLSIFLAVILGILVGILFLCFPLQLASFYLQIHQANNALTIHYIVWLFRLLAVLFLLDTLRSLITGSLRGMYDTRVPMWISMLVIWLVALPLAYYLGIVEQFGVIGARSAGVVGIGLGLFLVILRWRWQLRRLDHLQK